MSESGPSIMYAQQAVAFDARAALMGHTTDSTPETPPTHTAPDIVQLCALKKQVLQNLPTSCVHCKAEIKKEYIVEHNGSIMAYCKTPGACGRSLVLFAGVDFTYPVYAQTCVYTHAERTPPPAFGKPAGSTQTLSAAELEQAIQQLNVTNFINADPGNIYALHGIPNPAHLCDTCGKSPNQHKKCDQNGWYEVRRSVYALPSDWPVYSTWTKTWSNVN